jgi:hypothetical protein
MLQSHNQSEEAVNRKYLQSLMVVLLVSCLAAGTMYAALNTVQAQQRGNAVSTRQVWEYKVIQSFEALPTKLEAQLNQLGAEGWELATTTIDTNTVVYTFKRPK